MVMSRSPKFNRKNTYKREYKLKDGKTKEYIQQVKYCTKTGRKKLSKEQINEMFELKQKGWKIVHIAKKFNVSRQTVYCHIRNIFLPCYFNTIPNEIVIVICQKLELHDIFNFCCTSKKYRYFDILRDYFALFIYSSKYLKEIENILGGSLIISVGDMISGIEYFISEWNYYCSLNEFFNPITRENVALDSDLWCKLDQIYIDFCDINYWMNDIYTYKRNEKSSVLRTNYLPAKKIVRDVYFINNFFNNSKLKNLAIKYNYNIHFLNGSFTKILFTSDWFLDKYDYILQTSLYFN